MATATFVIIGNRSALSSVTRRQRSWRAQWQERHWMTGDSARAVGGLSQDKPGKVLCLYRACFYRYI